jgi:hypothetical protein
MFFLPAAPFQLALIMALPGRKFQTRKAKLAA